MVSAVVEVLLCTRGAPTGHLAQAIQEGFLGEVMPELSWLQVRVGWRMKEGLSRQRKQKMNQKIVEKKAKNQILGVIVGPTEHFYPEDNEGL